MLTAIITKLKTGTVKTVFAKSDPRPTNLQPPYIVVWEDVRSQLSNAQSLGGFFVAYHDVKGKVDDITNYLNNEVITLLHKVRLTTSDAVNFRLEDSTELSPVVDNEDGTISRDRLFRLPQLGSV